MRTENSSLTDLGGVRRRDEGEPSGSKVYCKHRKSKQLFGVELTCQASPGRACSLRSGDASREEQRLQLCRRDNYRWEALPAVGERDLTPPGLPVCRHNVAQPLLSLETVKQVLCFLLQDDSLEPWR